jgi:hypothetical protein
VNLVRLAKFAVLALQGLQLLGHIGRNPRPLAAVDLRLCAVQPILAETETIVAHRDGSRRADCFSWRYVRDAKSAERASEARMCQAGKSVGSLRHLLRGADRTKRE